MSIGNGAAPRGTYLARDPAGWLYGGTDPLNPNHRADMRTELDARIRGYQSQHPDTSRAAAEHAIRTADRQRAERFLARLKRHGLAALVAGPPGPPHDLVWAPDPPDLMHQARAIPLCRVCGAHALLAIHETKRGVCDWCTPAIGDPQPHPNGDKGTA
jgi:hypothetical protein